MDKGLGERIKALRTQNGLTQSALAEKIFVSESYIALIECGKRNPSSEIISKLSEHFGVSADFIMNGEPTSDDLLRVKEWKSLVNGRTDSEISGALKLVRIFFDNIDETKGRAD